MAQLEKNSDRVSQEETDRETEAEIKKTAASDAQTEPEPEVEPDGEEPGAGADAFDITRRFKHGRGQAPDRRQQAQGGEPQGNGIPRKRELVGVTDRKVETKRIAGFLALCFGVAWVSEIFAVIPMYRSGDVEIVKNATNMISQMMLTPALAAMVVRLATREGLVKSGFQLNFMEHRFLFLMGWFGTTILTFAGAVLYFLVFRDNFDPDMTGFVASYSTSAANAVTQIDAVNIVATYKTDLLLKLFTAAVLDFINSFGEEWGFRAYLLPKLYRKFGTIPAVLLSGFASGLWYAPLVAVGYYYGEGNVGFPVVNILAMCVFGTVTGVIYAYLCLRTGSIFPSVFAHSAVNVLMSQGALFTFDGGNFFVGPAPTGILSGLPFIIAAAVCLVDLQRRPIKTGE